MYMLANVKHAIHFKQPKVAYGCDIIKLYDLIELSSWTGFSATQAITSVKNRLFLINTVQEEGDYCQSISHHSVCLLKLTTLWSYLHTLLPHITSK